MSVRSALCWGLCFLGGEIVMNKKQRNININEDLGLKQVLG